MGSPAKRVEGRSAREERNEEGREGRRSTTNLKELESESDVVLEVTLSGDPHQMGASLDRSRRGWDEVGHSLGSKRGREERKEGVGGHLRRFGFRAKPSSLSFFFFYLLSQSEYNEA